MENCPTGESSQEPAGAAIEVRDLRVRRGGKMVLPGISLRVARGKVTGLLGPSGSGKTTLLRAIVGVQIVESGSVTVLGQPVSSHVTDEAQRCQELVLMRSGEIIATGSPSELLDRTHTGELEDAFVALAQAA